MQTIREIFKSSRPVSWINTAFPFAATYLFIGGAVDWVFIVGTLYFLIPYNILMYGINDVFDYESDMRNPRKGGIEGAVLAKRLHKPIIWTSIVSNVLFLVPLLFSGDYTATTVLAAVVFFVVAYSAPVLRFKERPVLDSITSSAHFVGPMVYALALVGWPAAATPVVVAFFLWGMASHAFGAVQDILADREANIGSIATVFGAQNTVRFAFLLYVTAAAIMFSFGVVGYAVALAGLLYAANIAPYLHVSDANCEKANKAWRRFIWLNLFAGFVVTITLILASGQVV
jgi:4-hydroxybenzoate polyprenyltransferase